jgi:hypothetical protein
MILLLYGIQGSPQFIIDVNLPEESKVPSARASWDLGKLAFWNQDASKSKTSKPKDDGLEMSESALLLPVGPDTGSSSQPTIANLHTPEDGIQEITPEASTSLEENPEYQSKLPEFFEGLEECIDRFILDPSSCKKVLVSIFLVLYITFIVAMVNFMWHSLGF